MESLRSTGLGVRQDYSRAFGDEPRNFKPWSSDEDDNCELWQTTPYPNFHITPTGGRLSLGHLGKAGLQRNSFLVRLAERRLHESNLLESSSYAFNVTGSIAYHHLSCFLATLDLNTLSNLNIPYFFLELIGNKREFIFPRKTPKKISRKVPYRFVTHLTNEYSNCGSNQPHLIDSSLFAGLSIYGLVAF
ncbi:hypothetical protein TNCV_578281 [Trichonephila clavipes]|nr:hypothetical protein TNCV_578281 [Trichonephila clavipes]